MITNVLQYLDNSSDKFPNKVAYVDDIREITYLELNNETKRIASNFIDYKNKPIAIFMDKSIDCLVSMYGVIRSGNFYTIIDTKMPIDRINNIFSTLDPVCVITSSNLIDKTSLFNKDVYVYEEIIKKEINEEILAKIRNNSVDTDPIYSLFTSGSTGNPKGYVVNHRGVIDFCEAMTDTFGFNENNIFANQSPLYFDLSISDVYCNLKNGSTVYLLKQSMFMFPTKTIDFLNEKKINTIFWVPSALVLTSQALKIKKPEYLKQVLFCGEVMPIKQLNEWIKYCPDVVFANLYGPAETVDASTYYIIDRDFNEDELLPIGKSFKNTKVFVIDENNNEVIDKDIIGELCIGGSSLSMGYYNNKEKTNDAFVQNPLNNKYLELIYKTGDLVKYNEYGELVYISRKDYQIKHMGYRIELGEIEASISVIEEIEQKACIYDDVNKKIVLFYQGKELSNIDILKRLKDKLPNYMIPNKIIKLDTLPHNANGKIDRKKLKEDYLKGVLV